VHGIASYLHKQDCLVDTEDDDATGFLSHLRWSAASGFFESPLIHGAAAKFAKGAPRCGCGLTTLAICSRF
jgi:hypothetical protein